VGIAGKWTADIRLGYFEIFKNEWNIKFAEMRHKYGKFRKI
jgi:hypothetical protein